MKLTLIRGLPGSGKSTLAKSLGCVHFEADMYFMRDGVYQFNPDKIRFAHIWCHANTQMALQAGVDVVVSNTFTRLWEMKSYLEMCDATVIRTTGNYASIHNVPQEAIEKMKSRFEDYPGEEIVYTGTDL